MERLDDARKVQRWKLSMKSLLCSICNVMVGRSRKVAPRWETMDRDILVKIFEKLNVIDVTMGASRVCISWFLVSHQKSLWQTINLADLQRTDFSHPRLQNLRLENVNIKGLYFPRKILTEITKFSSTAPTTLFFNFYSCVEDEDLIIAAEKTPNIIKLALPHWCNTSESSCRFAFNQWKNLQTLIITGTYYYIRRHEFQAIGENCKNLINLKLGCYVDELIAEKITCYLPKLKRLSLRWSVINNIEEVFSIITCLQNLTILNISHCIFRDKFARPTFGMVLEDSFVRTATQKVDTLIMCPRVDCLVCESFVNSHDFYENHWRDDEIKELEI